MYKHADVSTDAFAYVSVRVSTRPGTRGRVGRLAVGMIALSTLTAGCGDRGPTQPAVVPPPPGAVSLVTLATFDGSGQAVHPDPVSTPIGWGASQDFLVATPYPNGDATYENPSWYAGNASWQWVVPSGVSNPIARPRDGGYLSDPDQLYNPETNEIWLYYRQVTDHNIILLIRSADGVHWSAPVHVLSVTNHLAISPTVVRKGSHDWWMWTVNGGSAGCGSASTTVEVRRSTDGLAWSEPTTVTFAHAMAAEWPWHIDVEWVPDRGEYWAVYNAKTAGSCTTEVLRFATSPDGVHWTTFPSPLLQAGAIDAFKDVVYRSSLAYDATNDQVTLWYSGARYDTGRYTWRVATQQMSRETLFAIVSAAPVTVTSGDHVTSVQSSHSAPPLTNETAP